MTSLFRLCRALSLDVVLGAISVCIFISHYLEVKLPIITYVTLSLATWSIYTWDHLSDAKKTDLPTTFRHQFHKRYQRPLTLLTVLCIIAGGLCAIYLPRPTLNYGVIVVCLVLVYFALIQLWDSFYHKELFAAAVYCAGIFVAPVSTVGIKNLPVHAYVLLVEILLLALTNLLLFSEFERKIDLEEGHLSFIQLLGGGTKTVIIVLLLASIGLAFSALVFFYRESAIVKAQICLLLMSVILGFIYWKKDYFHINERYRVVGDGVFFVPVLAVL